MAEHLEKTEGSRWLVVALTGSGLLLLSLLETIFGHGDVTGLVLLTLFGVPVAWFLIRAAKKTVKTIDGMDLFSPLVAFPLAYIAWFTIGSIDFLQLPSAYSFGAFDPIPTHMWGYYALGLVSYVAGAWLVLRLNRGTRLKGQVLRISCLWQEGRLSVAVWALAIVMLLSYTVLSLEIGIPALQNDTYLVRLQIHAHKWEQLFLVGSSFTLLPLLAGYLWSENCTKGRRIVLSVLILVTAGLLTSLGGRGFLFQPLLTAVVARHYLKRKYKLVGLGTTLVLLFVMMSFYGYVRDFQGRDADSSPVISAGFPPALFPFAYTYLYIRGSVSTLRDVVSVIPSSVPYQYGWLTFQPLQVLLPGHHTSSDFFYKFILGDDFEGAGQPATLLAPFYADFGLPGIALGMAAFGALSMAVYQWMVRTRTVMAVLVYAWVVRTAIFALFTEVFSVPSDLWMPILWVMIGSFLTGVSGLNVVNVQRRGMQTNPSSL